MPQPAPFSPEWWTARLYGQLRRRQPEIARYAAYYRGDHPLPWLAPQAEDAFRRILKMTRTNYMGLVVDAMVERLEVLGFRDPEAWRIWQANDLDAGSDEAFLEAAKCGCSYLLVAPNPEDRTTPIVTVEHPAQVIIEYEPGSTRARAAALKVWADDQLGRTMATLYLPEWIYKFEGGRRSSPSSWVRRVVDGEDWPAENPLGVVPLVELRNNPQRELVNGILTYAGVSELADLTDIQDRINKTIADRLMTQDFGAFPQKWATGWDDEDDEDEATDGPESRPVDIGRDRLVRAKDAGVKFGQWDAAPLDPYSAAKSEDVKDMASRSRTPSQYLLGEIVNVSGDALQAAESGLTSKAGQRSRGYDDGLEESVRLMLLTAGKATKARLERIQTIWRDPQYRTLAQLTDAIVKQFQAGLISWQQALEKLGYTPTEIDRIREGRRADALMAAGTNLDALLNPRPAA